MVQYIYIDEKWFTLVTNGNGYYFFALEEQTLGNVHHKKHIIKVVFLSIIAQPRIVPSTGEMFDGKISIWAFAKERPATRSSKNRLKGTMGWHQLLANKKQVHYILIGKVLPAINMKWHDRWRRKTVLCQHDNMSPHLLLRNAKF